MSLCKSCDILTQPMVFFLQQLCSSKFVTVVLHLDIYSSESQCVEKIENCNFVNKENVIGKRAITNRGDSVNGSCMH